MQIHINDEAIQGFLRRAKYHYPCEHIEALWGSAPVGSFHIVQFHPMRTQRSGRSYVKYDDMEISRQRILARNAGLECLGTIHTHPQKEYDTSPSAMDHMSALHDFELVIGICYLYKKPSGRFHIETSYWQPQKPLKLVVQES